MIVIANTRDGVKKISRFPRGQFPMSFDSFYLLLKNLDDCEEICCNLTKTQEIKIQKEYGIK